MAVTFDIHEHSLRPGVPIADILLDGKMVAVIYPDGDKGIKLVSAHIAEVVEDDGSESRPPIPEVRIRFDPQPYAIEDDRLVRYPRE